MLKHLSQLSEAVHRRKLVSFSRSVGDRQVRGYVLDVGPRFFLILLVNDEQWFDGFQCFRISDVRDLQVSGYSAGFTEKALKLRGERRPRKPKVSLATLEELLKSANRAFPLITIHREKADPEVCHIGRVKELAKGWVTLVEIEPDATWDPNPQKYRLSEITLVEFGGDYEEALHLVNSAAAKRRDPQRKKGTAAASGSKRRESKGTQRNTTEKRRARRAL